MNKSTAVDTSEGNFQSTFAASIGSTVVAQEKTGEPGPAKGQGVDTKKSSSSDSKKKSSSSSATDGTIAAEVPGDSLQLLAIALPVPVNTAPQGGDSTTSVTSADPASEQLVISGAVAAGGNFDAAQIAAMQGQSLPVLEIAAVSSSAKNIATNGPVVPETSAELMPKSISTSAGALVPKTKAPDKADGTTFGVVGTASQPKESAFGKPEDKSDISTTDDLPVSQLSLPGAEPQTIPPANISAASAGSNTWSFKVPAATNEAPGTASGVTGSVLGKGRAASTRISSSADDKEPATGTDSESMKARIGAAEVVSKDVASDAGAPGQGTALAQSTHAPLLAGTTHSIDAQSGPAQSISSAAGPAAPVPAASAENVQAAHVMSSAQLIQSAHGSEMRLGMQSAEFGNISISTLLNHQALSAQISIDHSALGHALAAHLPAIEEKLGSAYGIQARVELRDTGNHSSLNDSSNRESKGNRQAQAGQPGTSTVVSQSGIGALTSSAYTSTAVSSSRLDIRI